MTYHLLKRYGGAVGLLLFMTGVLLSGCGTFFPDDTTKGERVGNKRPEVQITAGAANSDSAGIDYKVQFRWHGTDDDGVVALYQFAIDDTISEGAWRDTTAFSSLLKFRATHTEVDSLHLSDWHTFYVRAVDNEFAKSTLDSRYFNAETIAPSTRITFPDLRSTAIPQLLRTVVINWDGDDLDSARPDRKPVFYEYKLVRIREVTDDPSAFIDSLKNANNLLLDTLSVGSKRGWIRVPETTRTIKLSDLPGAASLAFGVRAIDEAGAVEPVLIPNRNFIAFIVRQTSGKPNVTVRESSLGAHTFPIDPPDNDTWKITVPSNTPLSFKWEGDATHYGSLPGNSNYALDISDPEDESLRDPRGVGGWIGWGRWEGNQYPIIFPTSEGEADHVLWIKMRDITDSADSEQICRINIHVVVFTFNKFALLVDDARFGRNPSDLEVDNYLKNTLLRRAVELGEVTDFTLFGSPNDENRAASPNDLKLETLSRYQHIFWSCKLGQNTQTTGLYSVERLTTAKLSSFLGAGGRFMIFGSQLSGYLTGGRGGQFGFPKEPPNNELQHDPLPGFDEDSFLWKFLHYKTYIQSVPNTSDTNKEQSTASGMIGARSLNPAYPDLFLDRSKWNPDEMQNCDEGPEHCQFKSGMPDWDGTRGTPATIVAEAGLDSLYAVKTFNKFWDWQLPGAVAIQASVEGSVIARRYESTHADTLESRQQGRTMIFGFQPWYLEPIGVHDAGTAAVNWLVTGKDH